MVNHRKEEGGTQLQRTLKREQILIKELEKERRRNINLKWTIKNDSIKDIEY